MDAGIETHSIFSTKEKARTVKRDTTQKLLALPFSARQRSGCEVAETLTTKPPARTSLYAMTFEHTNPKRGEKNDSPPPHESEATSPNHRVAPSSGCESFPFQCLVKVTPFTTRSNGHAFLVV
jgi:hypothetical protein